MAEVYGLMSTREHVIRYVGQTKGIADKRAWDHWRSSSNLKVATWSREELWRGYCINCVVIEECAESTRHDRETYWMQRIPNLLNERKVNHPSILPSEDEAFHLRTLQELERARDIDNWHGFVGISYHHPTERIRSDGWDTVTEMLPESWGVRVYDPFGKRWREIQGFTEVRIALDDRKQFRCSAEKYQQEHFGISLPWPPDTIADASTIDSEFYLATTPDTKG
jgi:hypothetical protein